MSTETDLPEPIFGKIEGGFAHKTIKEQLPLILKRVVNHVHKEILTFDKDFGKEAGEEMKGIIDNLFQLRVEIETNKPIQPLKSNSSDVILWNSYLEQQEQLYGFKPAWVESPLLYSECYMYRRMKEAFESSSYIQNYDPFLGIKKDFITLLLPEIVALAAILHKSVATASAAEGDETIFQELRKFFEICLWGNSFYLSVAAGRDDNTPGLLDPSALRSFIISNEIENIWNVLKNAAKKTCNQVRLDIVLSNAGYDLYTDLCLLELLDSLKMISEVHLYVKLIPWFVTNAMKSDIDFLLETLACHQDDVVVNYAKKWQSNFTNGKWVVEQEHFWTLPHDYSEMKAIDPDLYNKLSKSNLIIFKGDLNYRKLTSDRKWKVTVPFVTSLRGFLPAPLCSIRIIKTDVVCGLDPGVKERLDEINSAWSTSGKYAVIQCAIDGR